MESDSEEKSSINVSSLPEHHLPRMNQVKWLHDRLTQERKVIVVKGSEGSGKTTLLSEFVHFYEKQCISFFVGSDTWSSSPQLFLQEMCEQMSTLLNENYKSFDNQISLAQLKQCFTTLYYRVYKRARNQNSSFFFVIDGLDLVNNRVGEESIIDLLPFDPPNGLYLLVSSNQEYNVPFKHDPFTIPNFSQPETEHYLSDLGINKARTNEIFLACDGVPGYLNELRREISSGNDIEVVLRDLPNGFKSLLERKWNEFKLVLNANPAIELMAILSFSAIRLDVSQLSQISGFNITEVEEALLISDFVRNGEANCCITFTSDAHKRFVSEKLIGQKNKVEGLLIKFLETKPGDKNTFQYLPILYRQTNQFDSLKKLINTDYIVQTLQKEHDIDLLINNTKLVAETAYENLDWETLNNFSIVCSILNTLANRSIGEGEINALLSLNDHQTALNKAYNTVLPEDRLQFLAKICYDLKKNGIPLPEKVILDMDNLVLQVKPTAAAKDRMIEIAADLFHINPNTASELLNKFGSKVDGKLMDMMLAVLSLRLDDEPDSADMLRSMISNESVRDVARVNSPLLVKMDPGKIISEVDLADDISVKLFLLRSWCNSNRNSPKAIKVIMYALDLMTSSTEYSPSMRHLRQIAEPLISCEGEQIAEAINRIDILKNTSVVSPVEEKVRLELLLATVEEKNLIISGETRLYETYFSLDSIPDKDALCYCLSRFLISLPMIRPNDKQLVMDVENRLRAEFKILINNSADQFNITKRILRATSSVNPELAIEFAGDLNTAINRDSAYRDILSIYIDNFYEKLDLPFVQRIVEKLSEKERQDWAIVIALRKLAEKKSKPCITENCFFLTNIPSFIDPKDQCFAYAFVAKVMHENEEAVKVNEVLDSLLKSWSNIDNLWEQVEVGFNILTITGKNLGDFSRDFYEKIIEIKSETSLADESIIEVYINTVRLLIRTLPDILKGKNYQNYLYQMSEVISLIPSLSTQAFLFGEIALHLITQEKQIDSETLIKEKVLNCLDGIKDLEARSQTIVKVAPILYIYERNLLENELNQLSLSKKERALTRIIHFLLSKRNPDDPVDFEQINLTLDYKTVLQVIGIIKNLQTDVLISNSICTVVDMLCKKEGSKGSKEFCILPEKQSLTIAKELYSIIESKFPDKYNISHEGYKALSQSYLIRFRSAALVKFGRAVHEWERVAPSLLELLETINTIPNDADRAYVMALVGSKIYVENPNKIQKMLENCKNQIYLLNNLTDRAERMVTLADSWKFIDDKKSSIIFLKEAFTIASMLSWGSSRDEVTRRILEMAHSIDPEIASSLTSSIENPIFKDRHEHLLIINELQNKPHELNNGRSEDEIKNLIDKAAYKLLRSFCSGRGFSQNEKVVCDWLKHCKDSSYEDVYNVFSWTLENNLAMNQQVSLPQLEGMFQKIVESLSLTKRLGESLRNSNTIRNSNFLLAPNFETDLELYYAEAEMRDTIEKWLAENSGEIIYIYDGYFSPNDLSILKTVKPTSRVDIFTLWKTQKELKVGSHEIEQRYKSKWREISDQIPPETHISIIGIQSNGDGPIHDRYLICDKTGISIGTSISGLGKKDSGINHLNKDEVTQVEQTYIHPLQTGKTRTYKGERLETFTFTL